MEDKELAKEAANKLRELKSDVGMPDSMKFMFVEAKKRCTKPKEAANA